MRLTRRTSRLAALPLAVLAVGGLGDSCDSSYGRAPAARPPAVSPAPPGLLPPAAEAATATPPDAAIAPAAKAASSESTPTFESTVAPILAARCTPCHFPGGKMYARLPFDRPSVLADHRDGVRRRLKGDDLAAFEKWLATQPAAAPKNDGWSERPGP